MRKVVLKMHVSLDGYVRAASGDVMDWVFRTYDDELRAWEVDLLWQAGTHIMGRRLYEEMAAYWPSSTEAFAAPMNEIPKVVFSKTMRQADWKHSRVSNGDVAEELARLKQESGKDILATAAPSSRNPFRAPGSSMNTGRSCIPCSWPGDCPCSKNRWT